MLSTFKWIHKHREEQKFPVMTRFSFFSPFNSQIKAQSHSSVPPLPLGPWHRVTSGSGRNLPLQHATRHKYFSRLAVFLPEIQHDVLISPVHPGFYPQMAFGQWKTLTLSPYSLDINWLNQLEHWYLSAAVHSPTTVQPL